MIVDLGDSSNYGVGHLRPLFVNSSLRSYGRLMELATGQEEEPAGDNSASQSFVQFKAWLLSAAVNGESLNVCLPSFNFAGLSWSCSTLRKRLRLVSGAFAPGSTSPGLKAVRHPSNTQSKQSEQIPQATQEPQEPADYFGSATPAVARPSQSRNGSSEIVPLTETPLSTRITPHYSSSDGSASTGLIRQNSDMLVLDDLPVVEEEPSFDWTRIPVSDNMPRHIQFARSIDWASTALGPIELWPADLRQMCNLIMASPHPAAMYWGDDLIAIYNEAYILLAGQKHPQLMGQSYSEAWAEIGTKSRTSLKTQS